MSKEKLKVLQNVFDRGALLFAKDAVIEVDANDAQRYKRRGWAAPHKEEPPQAKTEAKGGEKGKGKD